MDDITIHTKKEEHESEEAHIARHCKYTHLVLDRLEKNDLYLKPEKCKFKKKEIEYLRLIISNNVLRMDPKKLKGVADWPIL